MASRQESYEARYFERMDRDRPKPPLELGALEALAKEAVEDPDKVAAFHAAMAPKAFLDALGAERWDRRNPLYSCIHCRDGKDIPRGYVCNECGESNPGHYDT